MPLIGNDAFQEADTTGITRPATKYNYLVKQPEKLASTVHEAFAIARSGRPGPVLVDLPKNITVGDAPYTPPSNQPRRSYQPQTEPAPEAIRIAVSAMKTAKRPLFYVGGGVINAGHKACEELTAFIRQTGFPCTQTLMGLGAFPGTDPQSLGMLGMHGTYEANLATHDCDVLIALGSRFDDRVTGRVDAFSPKSFKIHADIDPSQINKIIRVDVPIVGDAGKIISAMVQEWNAQPGEADGQALETWWAKIQAWLRKHGDAPLSPEAMADIPHVNAKLPRPPALQRMLYKTVSLALPEQQRQFLRELLYGCYAYPNEFDRACGSAWWDKALENVQARLGRTLTREQLMSWLQQPALP